MAQRRQLFFAPDHSENNPCPFCGNFGGKVILVDKEDGRSFIVHKDCIPLHFPDCEVLPDAPDDVIDRHVMFR